MNTEKAPRTDIATGELEYALDYMDEELQKLLCMAIVLCNMLRPEDPKNPDDDDDPVSWNVAQVLKERLESTRFSNTMRDLLHVSKAGQTA